MARTSRDEAPRKGRRLIPEESIDRIKQQTDLAALVRSRGVDLKKHGSKDLIGLCPFHDDHDPSFVVTPGKGLFHCLGCGAAGNAIQFVEKYDGISFRHAFELLAEGGPSAFSSATESPVKRATIPKLENPFSPEASDAELMDQVVDYYHERLLKSPAALDYLRARGIYNLAAISRFRLGFADRSLGLRLPEKSRAAGKAIRGRLEQLGIYRESGHEHFNGSLVVPILNTSGEVVEMYGRKITAKLRKGTPHHLYLPGPHCGIWNEEALNEPEIILCEAPLDALTFWVNGIHNVTFIYGTEGFTDELFNELVKRKVQRVRLAYDNDEAGNRAATREAERLSAQGIEVYRVRFPHGMDVNSFAVAAARQSRDGGKYAHKVVPPEKLLDQAVKSAEWIGVNGKKVAASASGGPAGGGKKEKPVVIKQGDYHVLNLGLRTYRVGGLEKNGSLDVIKITLRIQHNDLFHLDNLDLTQDVHRRRFIERAHEETRLEKELIKRDLGKLLFALEDAQTQRLNQKPETGSLKAELTTDEYEEAMTFLQSPNLIDRISETFDDCGLVGEEANRLAAYLACTSRKLDKPLAVIIQSTSAAGKSTLMEAVLSLFPGEEQVKYSAMTGQSLYYLGETNLKHKILAIVEEEGAEKASYALKLLQSEGELTIASTGKDPHTGRMETQEYHVEGPVMIFLTTTAIEIDEELLNRCLVLTVDESRKQTERIHALQRQARTLEGLQLKKRKQQLLALLRNVQRLLSPINVVNPWADQLTFTTERTRTRRDHEKYLTLIDSIALLHQHQRPRQKTEGGSTYMAVTLEDIKLANQLAPELLARSLDELPPQTRRVYEAVKQIVREYVKTHEVEQRLSFFSRRDIRERLGWGMTQVRAHLERLRELEYITARSGRPGMTFQYELLINCNEPDAVGHIGLLEVNKLDLRHQPVGKNGNLSGGCRPPTRQVKSVEKEQVTLNPSACSERTSGAPAKMAS